jgi:hypothetical protein
MILTDAKAEAHRLLRRQGKKPRGYWDRLANVKAEVDGFCAAQQLPPAAMPPKAELVRAGRYDLSHAVERWGGLYQLAELLDYQVGAPSLVSYSFQWLAMT